MKIFLMTDLEGVAGVKNATEWVDLDSKFYEVACRLLTNEVNAAVAGFFEGGADYVLVADGHGDGGIDIELLDKRVEYARGWPEGFPFGLDSSFDGIAWVGQHAKASSVYAHLCHTQSYDFIDLSVNGLSIGEFGQLLLCAAELGVPAFYASGDFAFTQEATALVPDITTCWTKRGVQKNIGEHCSTPEYRKWNEGAVHLVPSRSCEWIRESARKAIVQLRSKKRAIQSYLKPPYRRVAIFRPKESGAPKTQSIEVHSSSLIELMNMPYHPVPLESNE